MSLSAPSAPPPRAQPPARVLLRARLVFHGGCVHSLRLILDLNVRHLVPVTKDVGSIATEQVNVFFAVKVPHFAPFCPRVELTRVFSHHKPFVLQIQLVCWSLHKGAAGL